MTPDELRAISIILSECIQTVYTGARELLSAQTFAFIQAVELGKSLDGSIIPAQSNSDGVDVRGVPEPTSPELVDSKPLPQKPITRKKRGRPKKQK